VEVEMSVDLYNWQYWILQNLQLLSEIYGKEGVVLNANTWGSILIFSYRLPDTWAQKSSRLLIVLPTKSQIFYSAPDRFYMDAGLRTVSGQKPAHYFESGGFNDMASQGMARFSFHLIKNWKPKINCLQGTTLVDVIEAFYMGLDIAAKETME
jgi:hypothetical protein